MFEKHFTSADFITIGKSGQALFPARPFCLRFYGNGKNEVGFGTKSRFKSLCGSSSISHILPYQAGFHFILI